MSCENFESLKQDKNRNLLEQVWENTKKELGHYLRDYSPSLQSIVDSFRRIRFTIDPTEVAQYDPRIDTMIFNLWRLFFHPIGHEYCLPSPALKICETLIHEFDHYSFLKERKMIGRTDQEYCKFNSEYHDVAEKRALISQCNFLKRCREMPPLHETSYKIRVTRWTNKGKPLQYSIRPLAITKKVTVELIDAMITDCESILHRMNMGEEYDAMATEGSLESYSRMVTLLSLPIKLDSAEQSYPFVEVKS
jgi:hypothetical protein